MSEPMNPFRREAASDMRLRYAQVAAADLCQEVERKYAGLAIAVAAWSGHLLVSKEEVASFINKLAIHLRLLSELNEERDRLDEQGGDEP